jgi:hypothetical protein
MLRTIGRVIGAPFRNHAVGALLIVGFAAWVMAAQVTDRHGFANQALHQDVMERWGTPISQPAPSVRFVESGAVFNSLESMALDRQAIQVDASMNYRKRGLVFFSGFDFTFQGSYEVTNREGKTIDLAFVFPINVEKNRVLLSDLSFLVNGHADDIDLAEDNSLVWTGRLEHGGSVAFSIAFKGRGLDSFSYSLDPALPVRGFSLDLNVTGGREHDYAPGIVPAHELDAGEDRVALRWRYPALESGVPVGATLPSEQSYDRVITTIVTRGWVPFLLFFTAVTALAAVAGRRLAFFEAYLVAAFFGFFNVLLPYLAVVLDFHVAWAVSSALVSALVWVYLWRAVGPLAGRVVPWLLLACLWIPTAAVFMEPHTGLIYTFDILAGLSVLAVVTSDARFRGGLQQALAAAGVGGGDDEM